MKCKFDKTMLNKINKITIIGRFLVGSKNVCVNWPLDPVFLKLKVYIYPGSLLFLFLRIISQ